MNTVARQLGRPANLDLLADFDNVINGFFKPQRLIDKKGDAIMSLAIDVIEKDSAYEIHAELPGVSADELNVSVNDGVLTIAAETKTEQSEESDGKVIRRERRYGKYSRSLKLGSDVDESKIDAAYKDGVLILTLAKAEQVQPRKIAVNG